MITIDVERDDHVRVVCGAKQVATIVMGDVLDAAHETKKIERANRGITLQKQLPLVTDWSAFVDGVTGVTRHHPSNGVPDYIGPNPSEETSPEGVEQYQKSWGVGDLVRRIIECEQEKSQ